MQIIDHDPREANFSEIKPTVEDKWPNFEPEINPNTVLTEVLTAPHGAPQPLNPSSFANPNTEVGTFEYQGKVGDIFNSSSSIADCASFDFKMSAGIARTI